MKQKNKKRFLSALLALSMLCSIGFNGSPVRAEEENSDEVITLATAPENEFAHWTFSDVDIPNGQFGNYWNGNTQTTGNTLDMTIFQGKIKFPTVKSEFIIGQNVESNYNGFRFYNDGSNLGLLFRGTSETAITLATFDEDIAGTELINNEDLEVAFSVEYTDTTDGLVDMKVGVFFDGILYNGTYLTVEDVPEKYLIQTIRFQSDNTNVKWNAESIVTLDQAPENEFAHWTFSDVDIPNGQFGNYWNGNTQTTGNTLDMTIFQGKIKFPTVKSEFIIGQNVESNYNGFRFYNDGSNLGLLFRGTSETAITLATFDEDIAGTELINNEDLEVAFSVEYTDTTDGLVDMKVGVFFDGILYNGTYLTVEDVPEKYLIQTIRFQSDNTSVKWNAESIKITLGTALESKFTHWTFSDVNIPDGEFGERWTDDEVTNHTTTKSLNKTLFQGKIKFPTLDSTIYADFVIGQRGTASKYDGFRFHSSDGKLSLLFTQDNADATDATTETLITFDPEIARTTLIGNEDLEVAFSVEYTDITDGLVDMKVGVFFDGRLYNDTYLTVEDVPETYLKQAIRFRNQSVGTDDVVKWYAESMEDFETIVNPEITDSIEINYTVTIAPYILESGEPMMSFTMNGKTTDAIVGELVGDNTYKFTYPNIMAQNIADTITAKLTMEGHTKTYEYSMLDYCADVLNATTLSHESGAAYSSEQMDTLKELVVDLVEYGAEVQKYRNSSIADADLVTTKLANKVSSYADYDETDDTDLSGLEGVVTTKLDGEVSEDYRWKSATLVLGNKVKIRCQFIATNTSNLTIKTSMGDEIVDFDETDTNVYMFEIDNIYAYEYAEEIEIQFYEGETAVGQTLHYSVNTYLSAKQGKGYDDLLLAIHNYGDAATAYVKSLELRVLITSDLHYQNLGNINTLTGLSKEERLKKWVDYVNKEHAEDPFDLIVINGDLTLDYCAESGGEVLYENSGNNGLIGEFVTNYISQLPEDVPVYIMPGNHEQYGNENWNNITKCDRQGYMILNNSLFLFLDNYNDNLDPTEASDGTYTKTDVDYINKMMNQYPSCDVYLIAHYFDTEYESSNNSQFKNLVATNDRIKGLFQGHTHNAYTIALGEEWGNKTIAQTGSFANTDADGDKFWGFRELIITPHSAYSQFIQFECPIEGSNSVENYTRIYYTSYTSIDEE